ncbi:MAG TPA: PAS domain S-box protein [Gemmatimonadaceae bacterium]|nr:PAS domain S-box protein [Gemmatimonadaceae bacterium]
MSETRMSVPPGPDSPKIAAAAEPPQAAAAHVSASPALVDRLHKLLVASAQDYAIFALDPAGHVVSWNVGAERIKGYQTAEILGRHFSVLYPAEDQATGKPLRELEIAAREGRLEDEGWRVRRDGSQFWANVIITALRDETGTLLGFGKVTRDLTERRAAEVALRESDERLQLLVQRVRDYGIFMLDRSGYVASWNEGAERIVGYSAEEILGRHFSVFYPPDDVAAGKPDWSLAMAARDGSVEEEGWRVRKDGTRFWANALVTAIRDGSGNHVGYAKITRDLTEWRAAQERALADARRLAEAEAANRAKSEFLAAMSHELRTPLNAIGGYSDLLATGLGGPVTEKQLGYLDRIRRSQRHLLAIISDLLNFSRIEAGQLSYEITSVPLADAVGTVVAMVEPQAVAKGLRLDADGCTDGMSVRADRARLEQILLNLLTNAVKFTSPGGRVSVECMRVDAGVAVRVVDTGSGIHPDKIETIFEPFVQVGRSLTSAHEGTGLGLTISRDLATAMSGTLTVESTVGAGSAFTLVLPEG